ncbi:MAG: hypothetical protein JJU15_07110 [Pararhodobacter sp.]|nr:hypothetical protein [Pararhodobacter sp.]
MSMTAALALTWRRAVFFALVFVVIAFGLDAMLGRSVELTTRAATILIASGVYWVVTAWLMTRQQK